jgi:riboflavin kinase/FMN adenylyltransferase
VIETHLLDQSVDLYGEVLEVQFVQRIRNEMKFESVDSLTVQIAKDIENARQILKSSS